MTTCAGFFPLAGMLFILAGCASPAGSEETSSNAGRRAAHVRRVEHDGLPDSRCTPGAIRSGVSLATICAFGYSRSVRPPESYTEPLKLKQMRTYNLPGSPSAYEEDHLLSARTRVGVRVMPACSFVGMSARGQARVSFIERSALPKADDSTSVA